MAAVAERAVAKLADVVLLPVLGLVVLYACYLPLRRAYGPAPSLSRQGTGLLADLRSPDAAVRREAAARLRRLAQSDPHSLTRAVPDLIEVLATEEDAQVVDSVSLVLVAVDEPAVPDLLTVARDRRSPTVVRIRAIRVLGSMDRLAKEAMAALMALVQDEAEDQDVRTAALWALTNTARE